MKTPVQAGLLAILCASANAASVGVKFLDSNDVAFGTSLAGAPGYEQENWNAVRTDWSGSVDNDTLFSAGLTDSTGASVTILQNITYGANSDPVHYDSNNTWRSGAGNADANATLMNGYLDDGGDNQPYVNLSLAGGVWGSYNVVIYVNGDGQNGAVGRYWLEEWTDPLAEGVVITDRVGISSNSYSGTFVEAGKFVQTSTPANVDVASGNYIVFENITVRNLRIRSAGNGDPEDFGRGPLNAFQIIDNAVDTDNDGMPDAWEIANSLDPDNNQDDDGATGNPDGDGLTNLKEYQRGTNPQERDTDFDGLDDEIEDDTGLWVSETQTGTDPRLPDTDGDELGDAIERNTGVFASAADPGTNPNLADTDNDTLPDKWEIDNGLSPVDDGTAVAANGAAGDPDSDFSSNADEYGRGTDPQDADSDDDTLLDGYEDDTGMFVSATQTGSDPLDADTDNDTLTDDVETGTGVFVNASNTGTNPNRADTDGDYFRDDWEIAEGRDPFDGQLLSAANGGIGLNFGAGRGGASLLATGIAGVAPQANWNNLAGAAGGPTALVDQTGATLGTTVTWQADEEWSNGAGTDPNGTLLVGWISANTANANTIGIAAIPYARYDLIVYFNHDRVTEDVDFGESNGAFPTVRLQEADADVGAANPLYQQVASADGNAANTGTFYYIPGLTATALNLTMSPAGAAGSVDRGAITAIQIVAAPVPLVAFEITSIERVPSGPGVVDVTLTWNSTPGANYGIDAGSTLDDFVEIDDAASQGNATTYTEQSVPETTPQRFYRIRQID